MDNNEFLGLDIGLKKTGIARASVAAKLAEPLGTVPTAKLIDKLKELVKDDKVQAVVVGLPRNLHGNDTPQTNWVRDWVTGAKSKLDAPFYWQDEALTSRIAEVEKAVNKKHQEVDSLAAAIILQDFLDTTESERVIC